MRKIAFELVLYVWIFTNLYSTIWDLSLCKNYTRTPENNWSKFLFYCVYSIIFLVSVFFFINQKKNKSNTNLNKMQIYFSQHIIKLHITIECLKCCFKAHPSSRRSNVFLVISSVKGYQSIGEYIWFSGSLHSHPITLLYISLLKLTTMCSALS